MSTRSDHRGGEEAADAAPYLSFVVCSRNDDYAGDMVQRLQASMDVLAGQVAAYDLSAEVIIVEWNPPTGRSFLSECLDLSAVSEHMSVRFIRVPLEVHQKFDHWESVHIQVPAANNVGLRRARGRFVVARASDAYYSNQLVEFLARRELEEGVVYRCHRVDVDATQARRHEEWRDALRDLESSAVVRVHGPLTPPLYPPILPLFENASGDFLLASRDSWHEIRGFPEGRFACSMDHDGLALHALAATGSEVRVLPRECYVLKPAHAKHTLDKVRTLPLPEEIRTRVEALAHDSDWIPKRFGCAAPDEWGDVVRFWFYLLLGVPRRAIDGVGEVRNPTYLEFQYRAYVVDKNGERSAQWRRERRRGGLSLVGRGVVVGVFLWHVTKNLAVFLAAGRARSFVGRVVRLISFAWHRPIFRMNSNQWGCEAYPLEELSADRMRRRLSSSGEADDRAP